MRPCIDRSGAVSTRLVTYTVNSCAVRFSVLFAMDFPDFFNFLGFYNAVASEASSSEVRARFPSGSGVAITEPYFKICADGKASIRIDNPGEIRFIDPVVNTCSSTAPVRHGVGSLERLENIRSDGNKLFAQQNWTEAVSKYTQCIDEALSDMETADKTTNTDIETAHKTTTCDAQESNGVLKLAYSNRAEARLRLESYDHEVLR